jgi:crossover junction endodeoxyribonuclease RuvC
MYGGRGGEPVMSRILGVDPGSRITGYGIIDADGNHHRYITSGCIRVSGKTLAERLGMIFTGLHEVIAEHQPQQMAVEQVFMHRNADSALKLGQARGAAICAGVNHGLTLAEYAPREIKQAMVGRGGADKTQVQHMVRVLLNLTGLPQADAADALAVALCHSHTRSTLKRIPGAQRATRGRLR